MARAKFHFGPQPALDKAVARQRQCEEALVASRKEAAAEEAKLAAIQKNIAETKQQIASEHDKLVTDAADARSASAVAGRRRYIEALNRKEVQQQAEALEQAKQVRWANQRVELRKEALSEAMQAVKALEKAKERAGKQFEIEKRKAEDRERDDMTAMRFKRPSRRGE